MIVLSSLTPQQQDVLQEVINIGVGWSAGILNEMIASHINLNVPQVRVLSFWDCENELKQILHQERICGVRLDFKGGLIGNAQFILSPANAFILLSLLLGDFEETCDFDRLKSGTLTEIGNILINGVMGAISNLINEHLSYSLPIYYEGKFEEIIQDEVQPSSLMILAQSHFEIPQYNLEGQFLISFNLNSFESLINTLEKGLLPL